jgi:hypothetical protein
VGKEIGNAVGSGVPSDTKWAEIFWFSGVRVRKVSHIYGDTSANE